MMAFPLSFSRGVPASPFFPTNKEQPMNPTDEERDEIVAMEAETRSIEDDEQAKYDHDEHFGRKP